MSRLVFPFLLGSCVIGMSSLPLIAHADIVIARPGVVVDRQGTYGYPNHSYYEYNYPSDYSPYPIYSNPYVYPGYRAYYHTGNMYNPNTTFVNPPSPLNAPRYPVYSETYLYR